MKFYRSSVSAFSSKCLWNNSLPHNTFAQIKPTQTNYLRTFSR